MTLTHDIWPWLGNYSFQNILFGVIYLDLLGETIYFFVLDAMFYFGPQVSWQELDSTCEYTYGAS